MKINLLLIRSFLFASTFYITLGCSDDPNPANEEELITSVKLTFTKVSAEPLEFLWNDPDGETGSGVPEIDNVVLLTDSEYNLSITLGDESSGTLVDITGDISDEATDHQFFFQPDVSLDDHIDLAYNDEDADGNPLGLNNVVQTSGAGSGKLKLILRHKPKKDESGVSEGNITNAGGDTDIEIEFEVSVEE